MISQLTGEVVEAAGAAGTDQGCELPTAGESPPEKSCVGRFGSFTAQFNDGMTLSVSTFGPSGEPPNGKNRWHIYRDRQSSAEVR